MKSNKTFHIQPETLYNHPRDGKISLQIPNFISFSKNEEGSVECPEEWFWTLNSDKIPSSVGFLYWSKKGWFKNRKQIKEAFESCSHFERAGKSWEDFDDYAKRFFLEIEDNTQDEITRLKKKLSELTSLKFKLW